MTRNLRKINSEVIFIVEAVERISTILRRAEKIELTIL